MSRLSVLYWPLIRSYYYKVYKQIVDNAGLPLSGDACWFAPCRDSTDRLRTKLIIDTTTKEGACPVPQSANVCIGCTANDKNIINQYCKIVNPDPDPIPDPDEEEDDEEETDPPNPPKPPAPTPNPDDDEIPVISYTNVGLGFIIFILLIWYMYKH